MLNDQRSYIRPVDGDGDDIAACDIGAYEYGASEGPGSDIGIQTWDTPDPVAVDGSLTYNIVVTNNGPEIAGLVEVTDTLPANATWLSSSINNGICMGSKTVKCYMGALFNSQYETISIVVAPNVAGTINNTVGVISETPDPSMANNSAIAATFIFTVQRVESSTPVGYYATIQDAFKAALSGDVIKAEAITFNENTTFYSNVHVILQGGFDTAFTSGTGYSTIVGAFIKGMHRE